MASTVNTRKNQLLINNLLSYFATDCICLLYTSFRNLLILGKRIHSFLQIEKSFIHILCPNIFYGNPVSYTHLDVYKRQGYGMDSVFGPLEISLGYSNQTDKGSCFVNLGYYF